MTEAVFLRLAVAAATIVVAACTQPLRSTDLQNPVLYANQHAGDCAEVAEACTYETGLLVAIWSDGRVLRAASADDIGNRYVYGRLERAIAPQLLQRIDRLRDDDSIQLILANFATHSVYMPSPGKRWSYSIPIGDPRPATVEEIVLALMSPPLEGAIQYSWQELPRFDSPVLGEWELDSLE